MKWKAQLASCWPRLNIRSVVARRQDDRYVFEVQLFLDELEPDAVRVEVYAEGRDGDPPTGQPMTRIEPLTIADHLFLYRADVSADRPLADYTPRVVPFHAGAAVPLETPYVLWYERR